MKPLTIEIPESLQQKLIEIANQSNVTVESYILGILDRAAEVPNHSLGTTTQNSNRNPKHTH